MKTFLKQFMTLIGHPEKPVTRVVFFGAVGGILAVLSALVLGELKHPWYFILIPYLALGAGAAFVSVFVLLGIKTEDVWRCCGIALLAGFFWQPVFEAGKEYVLNQPERAAEAETARNTQTLEDLLGQLANSPTNTVLIKQAGNLAATITRETAVVRDSAVKTRAQSTLARTLNQLSVQADQGQPAALVAVAEVAETAATTGNRPVAEKAWTQISRIPVTTNPAFEVKRTNAMNQLKPFLYFQK